MQSANMFVGELRGTRGKLIMKHRHLHRQVTWKNGTNTIARPKICKAREKNLFLILQLVKTSIWRRQKLKPTRRFIKTRNNNAGKKEKREQSSMLTKPIRTGKFSFHSAAEKERERKAQRGVFPTRDFTSLCVRTFSFAPVQLMLSLWSRKVTLLCWVSFGELRLEK